MKLLCRLISHCSAINGLSDTRIYCAILVNQIEIALDGIESYCEDIKSGYDIPWSYLDEGLRNTVYALNTYAKCVRDNNLQSLQAPNYNLEFNVSIEKCLLGYSYFLSNLIDLYNNAQAFAQDLDFQETCQHLYPVMIPQASNNTLAIRLLFPQLKSKEPDAQSRIMLVECPSLRELTNVPEIIASLFHEVAHQFRYENRSKRNNVLLSYNAHIIFNKVFGSLAEELRREISPFVEERHLFNRFEKTAAETFIETFYPECLDDEYILRMPLNLLCCRLRDDLSGFVEDSIVLEKYTSYYKGYIESIKQDLDINDGSVREALIQIGGFIKNYLQAESLSVSTGKTVKEIIQDMVQETKENVEKLWTMASSEKPVESNDSGESGNVGDIRNIRKVFLLNQLDLFLSRDCKKQRENCLKWEKFYKNLYDKICEVYRLASVNNSAIGRYLCIDYCTEKNQEVFVKVFETHLRNNLSDILILMDDKVKEYREQTSDIFMINMIDFTAYGYLYMMVRNLKMNNEPLEAYLRRIATVMYIVWGDQDSASLHTALESVWETAQKAIQKMLEHYYQREELRPVINRIIGTIASKEGVVENELDIYLNGLNELRDKMLILEGSENNVNNADGHVRIQSDIEHQIHVLRYLIDLDKNATKYVKELMYYQFIMNDLKNGVKLTHKWHEECKNDLMMRYCKRASDFFNCPEMRYSDNYAEFNSDMIWFIQFLFYGMKFDTASNMIRGENLK